MKISQSRGFTLVEVTIVLMVLALLAAILVPSIGGFNSLARGVRMSEDLGALCSVMKMMLDDLGDSAFFGHYGSSGYTTSTYGISQSGSSSWSYGSGGSSSITEQRVTGDDLWVENEPADDWCVNCDMPRSECGDHCMDDCDETCTHPVREPIRSVTTQTRSFGGGAGASGGSTATRWSTGTTTQWAGGIGGGYYGFPVGLLAGDGDIPGSAIGATGWQLPLGATFTETTDAGFMVPMNFTVDSLSDQLIHEDPTVARYGYGAYADRAAHGVGYGRASYGVGAVAYGQPFFGGTDQVFRWRGPYIADRVTADPWGNRYMANVFALHVPAAGTYGTAGFYGREYARFTSAVVCYSAGRNETIETFFNQPRGWYSGGDDRTVVLAGAGGIR